MEEEYKCKALAEELAEQLDDQDDLGFYFTLAKQHDHQFLRDVLHWVTDYPNPQNKGRLFTWRLKNVLSQREIPEKLTENDEAVQKLNNFKANFGINKKYEK